MYATTSGRTSSSPTVGSTPLGRDDLGRVISATHPDSSSETWAYNLAGNLARHHERATQTMTMTMTLTTQSRPAPPPTAY